MSLCARCLCSIFVERNGWLHETNAFAPQSLPGHSQAFPSNHICFEETAFGEPLWKKPFKNIEGKGENAGYQHFLLFPQCFNTILKQISFL